MPELGLVVPVYGYAVPREHARAEPVSAEALRQRAVVLGRFFLAEWAGVETEIDHSRRTRRLLHSELARREFAGRLHVQAISRRTAAT